MQQSEIFQKYGDPMDWSYLVYAELPYEMVIAWDKKYTVSKFWCNHMIKDNIEAALSCVLDYYGIEEIERLGLDQFGGCHEDRKMRGGSKWSRHSWGIAIDLDPKNNGLRTKAPKATFSQDEFKPLIDIFYDHNFINYGIEKGYDWMHFEIKD